MSKVSEYIENNIVDIKMCEYEGVKHPTLKQLRELKHLIQKEIDKEEFANGCIVVKNINGDVLGIANSEYDAVAIWNKKYGNCDNYGEIVENDRVETYIINQFYYK